MTRDERLAAAWALLRSYADWMPGTRTSTGQLVRRASLPGEVASDFEECRTCAGEGVVRRGGSEVACRTCRGLGALSVDAYTRREVEPEARIEEIPYERLIRFRRVRCDACGGSGVISASSVREPGLRDVLEVDAEHHWWRQAQRERCLPCRGSGSVEIVDERSTDASLRRIASDQATRAGLTVSEDWLDSALERRRAQWARGSYGELAEILRRLELRVPRLHAALLRHVVYEPGEYVVSDELHERLLWTIRWIADQLPERIRVSSDVLAAHTRRSVPWKRTIWRGRTPTHHSRRFDRDEEILTYYEDGYSAFELAAEYKLTRRRIGQIIREQRERQGVAA